MARSKTPHDIRMDILQKSIDYIESQLKVGGNLSVKQIADNACTVERNLLRRFRSDKHESVSGFVTRLKVEKAQRLIAYTLKDPELIYEDAGFRDYESFERAYCSLKEGNPHEYLAEIKIVRKNCRESSHNGEDIILEDIKMVAVRDSGDYNGSKPEVAWGKLNLIIRNNNWNLENAAYYGVLYDDTVITKKDYCRYDACILLNTKVNIGKNLREINLPGGRYQRFRHNGPYSELEAVYSNIYDGWDEHTLFDLGERPIIEKYLNAPQDIASTELLTEIYIPVHDKTIL
ncbi:MAG: AraC family transcriptional regulator [Bacteroidota bacterium]